MNFFQPHHINDAIALLNTHAPATLLAGGTDILLEIRQGHHLPTTIIDLRRCLDLKTIEENDQFIAIGSMVTFAQLVSNPLIKKHFNALIESAKNMGSPQIRNMATVGGNIINAGAAADITPCIIALDGLLVLESSTGKRTVLCEDYFKNNSTEHIQDKEVLTKILVPKTKALTGFYKLGKRNALAIARLSVVTCIELEEGIIQKLSVCLGAVGKYPFRATELEVLAINQPVDWLLRDEPLQLLEQIVSNSIKGRKTMPFKKEAVKGVYKEALKRTLNSKSLRGE